MAGETDLIARIKCFLATVQSDGWTPEREDACTDLLGAILTTLEASDADTVRRCPACHVEFQHIPDVDAHLAMLTASHPKPEPVETQP